MLTYRTRTLLIAAAVVFGSCISFAQKKPIDHSVYDGWQSVQGNTLSANGKWLLYRVVPQEGDATVEVKSVAGDKNYSFARGALPSFSKDGNFVASIVVPPLADTKKARRAKAKPEDMPKNSLLILNLQSGEKTEIPRVTSFSIAADDSGWILYKPEPPKPEAPTKPAADKKPDTSEKKDEKKPGKKADHKAGDVYVLRQLSTGKEVKLEDVSNASFSKDGSVLVYGVSTKDGAGDALVWYDVASGKKTQVAHGMGHYTRFSLAEKADKLAFLTDRDDYAAKKPSNSLFYFTPANGKAVLMAKEGSKGVPNGWWIADLTPSFTDKATRIDFKTQPKPVEEKKDETPDDEKASLDVWNWKDPILQPQQLLQAKAEANRSYDAVVNLGSKSVVQLEQLDMPNVTISEKGDGDVAIGSSNLPYQISESWGLTDGDYWTVNPNTGERKPLLTKSSWGVGLSPTGHYAIGYQEDTKHLWSIDMKTGKQVEIAKDVQVSLANELNDIPADANAYGFAGWTKGDGRLLVYDRYDIWSVDPAGNGPSINITHGIGRGSEIRFRYLAFDPKQTFIPADKPMVLGAFNEHTKASGFYKMSLASQSGPEKIVMEDKLFGTPTKAKEADTIAFTKSDFTESNDVWLADSLGFSNQRKVSSINAQQANYNWCKTELVQWISNDGIPLQGILVKPEDFDPTKKYPMITYFYERDSDTLHQYHSPAPSASTVNIPYFASNGYVMFIPDIAYKIGYPGESAISCIMPGIQSILARGFVDPKRLAIQGQSWGGYEVAYMVTETNMFACASAGAAVSDMFSAYGGIRWGSGLVRQFQYEKSQSRIGGTPWNSTLRFIENSPIFFADKIQTPLLMMNNDKDGSVPWYQGIELFTALRRMSKPAWLLVYNEEDHNLVERKNRKDLSVRLAQFFDHYLKGAPMPVWMDKGVPATMKSKTYGFETPGRG